MVEQVSFQNVTFCNIHDPQSDPKRKKSPQKVKAEGILYIDLVYLIDGRSGGIRTHDPFTPSDVPEENGI